jgi:hypothetical protein
LNTPPIFAIQKKKLYGNNVLFPGVPRLDAGLKESATDLWTFMTNTVAYAVDFSIAREINSGSKVNAV